MCIRDRGEVVRGVHGPPQVLLGPLPSGGFRDEHLGDVEGVDAVDEGVVGLRDDREPAVFEAFDEVDLPQRCLLYTSRCV